MATDAPPTLTVYSRSCCPLCDELIGALRDLQALFHFGIDVVDVDTELALERRYGNRVPVLMHGARELCHGQVDRARVTAYLSEFR